MSELTKTVHVKMSEKQFEQLEEAAWSRRLSNSEWVRQCVFGLEKSKIQVRIADPVAEKVSAGLYTPGVLKEGYGWCKACGAAQVKLPGLLCKKCSEQ